MQDEQELLNRSELYQPGLSLKDVTEDRSQQNESPNRRSGRKKLFMAGGLIALLLVTIGGGYFLLRGKDQALTRTAPRPHVPPLPTIKSGVVQRYGCRRR